MLTGAGLGQVVRVATVPRSEAPAPPSPASSHSSRSTAGASSAQSGGGAGEGIDDREKSLTSLPVSTAATPFAPFTSLGAPSWFVLLLSLPPTSPGESLDL
jgi:hypothetical protein